MLAVAHAIAYQIRVEDRTAKEFRDIFLSRLKAFLLAKDLVEQSSEAGVDLAMLVDEAIHGVEPQQIRLERGPSILAEPAQVRPLSMILHELTTNALKYGALSTPDGFVRLSWSKTGQGKEARLELDWREEGGPPAEPPKHSGFGTTMIERSASAQGGKAELRFERAGLRARIMMPISQDYAE